MTEHLVFLLVEGLSMMSLSSAIEPLRSANRLTGLPLYRWTLASLDGNAVFASNGIELQATKLDDLIDTADYLFVCGGLRLDPRREPAYLSALRRAARTRAVIGSLSTGSYLLAQAGLLDGFRCTIHWENLPAFTEAFPHLACSGTLYEIDGKRMTCSGGIAAMDMMLHLIAERVGADGMAYGAAAIHADSHADGGTNTRNPPESGADLAVRIANQFHHERIRDSRDEQHGWRELNHASLPRGLRRAIDLMRTHVESPLPIVRIGETIGMTSRQMERLFLRHLAATPAHYYVVLRLERARELLAYSSVPIAEVALATGFASASHLARWTRRIFQESPTALRKAQPRA